MFWKAFKAVLGVVAALGFLLLGTIVVFIWVIA